jgi:hypothetical protein
MAEGDHVDCSPLTTSTIIEHLEQHRFTVYGSHPSRINISPLSHSIYF